MPRVKVWNDNSHVLKETFKGDPIEIKPHQCIEMEFFEAHEFKGQYHMQPLDAMGKIIDDPKYRKMVRIEKIEDGDSDETETKAHTCMSCKKSYESEPVLKAHIETAHSNQSRLELPEVDHEIKKKTKKVG
jgi:hypothetical protein